MSNATESPQKKQDSTLFGVRPDRVKRAVFAIIASILLLLLRESGVSAELPETFQQKVADGAKTYEVDFQSYSMRSPNFRVLADEGESTAKEVETDPSRTYLGKATLRGPMWEFQVGRPVEDQ